MPYKQQIDQCIKNKKIFFVGDKLPDDWYEAFLMWNELAQKNDSKAQFNLAYCFELGEGTDKNIDKAIKYYNLSAKNGVVDGYYNIYQILKNSDEKLALEYLEEGVKSGSEISKRHIENAKNRYLYNIKRAIYNKYYPLIIENLKNYNFDNVRKLINEAKKDGVGNWFDEIENGINVTAKLNFRKCEKRTDYGYEYTLQIYNPTNTRIKYSSLTNVPTISPKETKRFSSSGSLPKKFEIYFTDYSAIEPKQSYFDIEIQYTTSIKLDCGWSKVHKRIVKLLYFYVITYLLICYFDGSFGNPLQIFSFIFMVFNHSFLDGSSWILFLGIYGLILYVPCTFLANLTEKISTGKK